MSNNSNLIAGIILGAVAGTVAGLLLSPSSGKENREKLKEASSNFKDELDKKLKGLSEKIDKETLNDIKESFENSKGRVKNEYDVIAKKVKDLEQEIEEKIRNIKNEASKLTPKNS